MSSKRGSREQGGPPTLVVEGCFGRQPSRHGSADDARFRRERLASSCHVTSLGIADSLEWARESAAKLAPQDVADRALLVQCEAHNNDVIQFAADRLPKPLPANIGGGAWGENVLVGAGTYSGVRPAAVGWGLCKASNARRKRTRASRNTRSASILDGPTGKIFLQ